MNFLDYLNIFQIFQIVWKISSLSGKFQIVQINCNFFEYTNHLVNFQIADFATKVRDFATKVRMFILAVLLNII